MATQRTINHGNGHIDTERLFTDADGNQVWAVIQCNQESDMTIWNKTKSHYETKSVRDNHDYDWVKCHNCKVPYVIVDGKAPVICDNCGVQHDAEQIKLRDSIVTDCTDQVTHFTSAIAGAYIVDDAHPVEQAQAIEQVIDAQLSESRPTYDELLKGAKFTDAHRAELHKWWNEKYADRG